MPIRIHRSVNAAIISVAFVLSGCSGPDEGAAEDADQSEYGIAVGQKAKVQGTAVGLNLRSGVGTSFSVLKVMPEGAIVTVVAGPNSGWYQVTHDGTTGWCSGAYLVALAMDDPNNRLPWTAGIAYQVTQGHNGGSHTGAGAWAWDFGLPIGTPVRAAHYGTVRRVKGNSTQGGCWSGFAADANYVIVDQGGGYESLYLHLASVEVQPGDWVNRGDLVGHSGQTGWSCGPHLHFQVQLSPTNGGGTGWYNPSVHDVFHDTGAPKDPAVFTWPVSANHSGSTSPQSVAGDWELESDHLPTEVLHVDPHGGGGESWDEVMRALQDD